MPRNVAIRWKKWPLFGLGIFLVSLIIMLFASLNDLEKAQLQEKKDRNLKKDEDFNPYATEPTKIIMPKEDENKESTVAETGNRNAAKRNEGKDVLPEGYIHWKEPHSKLSDPNGPGQGGKSVPITADESKKIQEAYNEYGFNQYVSDQVSLHRSVPDVRPIRLDIYIFTSCFDLRYNFNTTIRGFDFPIS